MYLGSSPFSAASSTSLRAWPYHRHVSLYRVFPPHWQCYHQLGVRLDPLRPVSKRYRLVLYGPLGLVPTQSHKVESHFATTLAFVIPLCGARTSQG